MSALAALPLLASQVLYTVQRCMLAAKQFIRKN